MCPPQNAFPKAPRTPNIGGENPPVEKPSPKSGGPPSDTRTPIWVAPKNPAGTKFFFGEPFFKRRTPKLKNPFRHKSPLVYNNPPGQLNLVLGSASQFSSNPRATQGLGNPAWAQSPLCVPCSPYQPQVF